MLKFSSIAVVGAGSWGTALASHLARQGINTLLWGRDATRIRDMQASRVNQRYLDGQRLPDALCCCESLSECLEGAQAILLATPTSSFSTMLKDIRRLSAQVRPLAWACKGLERGSGRLLHEVAREILGDIWPLAIISGPTFAVEVMRSMPTAMTVASEDVAFAERLSHCFHSDNFRAYRSDDIIGVQIGGALKNVFAIAAGTSDGLGFGANARAALITRGLAELMRLGVAIGGRSETLAGLAGMGDLVLTCTDDNSRNRRMGLALAKGLSVEQARASIDQSIEGISTAEEAMRLSRQYAVDMPISEQVYEVLYRNRPPRLAVQSLLSRTPKVELC